MANKKKKSASEYEFFHIKLIDFSACVDASINYEVRDNRHYKIMRRCLIFRLI